MHPNPPILRGNRPCGPYADLAQFLLITGGRGLDHAPVILDVLPAIGQSAGAMTGLADGGMCPVEKHIDSPVGKSTEN